ncbi:glycosyltransferase family 2 protein [Radiobacillus kanasensis]|nr:glycosyltransferase family 2 protein [Radiobacillus kanasensis]UFT98882.1 glycosyltransferase family 2 protein [Radiobacillus kanasensis]
MKLSIIVPCYEEEKVLKKFYNITTEILTQNNYNYEIIFVNDGSKDNTKNIIKDLSSNDKKVKFASFSRNFGKEAAMLAGLTFASGDAYIIMDADLQHPPSLIPEMVKGYKEGFDQVIARRTRKGESVSRSSVSKLYYRLINKFVDVELTDGIGDFRLLSKRAANAIVKMQEYNRFSKGLFSWIGFEEKVIEYDNIIRGEGESKWTFSKLLSYGIDGIISFNNKPLRVTIYLGFFVTLLAVLYVIFSFFQKVIYGIDVPGYFTTISSVLILGGIQLISLGVIGEYIGRIYYETKRRPHFIIEDQSIERE